MLVVEHIKDGYDHSDGNAAIIASLLLSYPEEKIHFFCGVEHFKVVKHILESNNIPILNLEHCAIIPYNNFVRDYKLIISDFKIVKKMFFLAKRMNENKIIFLYTSTFMLYYLKLFCFINKNINVVTFLHGDLERIDLKSYVNTFRNNRLIMFMYALFFGLKIPLSLKNIKNLKYVVYGESIKENACKIIPNLRDFIKVLPHPYLYEKMPKHIPQSSNVKLGIIGLSSSRKNIFYLEKLIRKLSTLKTRKFSLSFSGKILDDRFFNFVTTFDFIDKSTLSINMISSDRRNNIIRSLDYAIFTYNLDSYKLIASGAFIDAINFEKPIIAIKNDFIEYYFNKYGNIGYIFNTYEEFEKRILEIIDHFPREEYEQQVNNLKIIKSKENIYSTAALIKKI